MKKCIACQRQLNRDYFRYRADKGYYESRCIVCEKEYQKKYRENYVRPDPVKIKELKKTSVNPKNKVYAVTTIQKDGKFTVKIKQMMNNKMNYIDETFNTQKEAEKFINKVYKETK